MSRSSTDSPIAAGTNLVVLRGTLSRAPEVRALPSGDAVAAFDVTIRPDPADGGRAGPTARAESVPVAWFDPPAAASRLGAGDEVVVVGRVRRRFFRAGSSTASRTEVVAERVVPARSTAKVASALAPVAARLGSRR
jgi:single-strand DNA-binding protein